MPIFGYILEHKQAVLSVFILEHCTCWLLFCCLLGCSGKDFTKRSAGTYAQVQSDDLHRASGDDNPAPPEGGDKGIISPPSSTLKPPPTPGATTAASLNLTVTEAFSDKVDLLMVVDNGIYNSAGSDRVRNGVHTLVKGFSSYSDAQFAVLTAKKPPSGANVSACLPQISQSESNTFFDLPTTSTYAHINCAIDGLSDLTVLMKFLGEGILAGVKLDEVFRPGSIKAFLLISDEGAVPNHEAPFIEAVEKLWDKDLIRFYHYSLLTPQANVEWRDSDEVSLSRRFPWMKVEDMSYRYADAYGRYKVVGGTIRRLKYKYYGGGSYTETYNNLSKRYNGAGAKGFDLIESRQRSDWSPTLGTACGIHKFPKRSYKLTAWSGDSGLSISAVELDGTALGQDQWSLDSSGATPVLNIADSVDLSVDQAIKVTK